MTPTPCVQCEQNRIQFESARHYSERAMRDAAIHRSGVEARLIVRAGLRDVREWLGETSAEHEDYEPRHIETEPHIVPMLWRARSENA